MSQIIDDLLFTAALLTIIAFQAWAIGCIDANQWLTPRRYLHMQYRRLAAMVSLFAIIMALAYTIEGFFTPVCFVVALVNGVIAGISARVCYTPERRWNKMGPGYTFPNEESS